MRSNEDFIELTSNKKKYLINKKSIIFVTPGEKEDEAVVVLADGDRERRCVVRESYSDISSELLWGYNPKNVCLDDYEIDFNSLKCEGDE